VNITPIVLIALVMDIFVIFGVPALIGPTPMVLSDHILGVFVFGDAANSSSLHINETGVTDLVSTSTGGGSMNLLEMAWSGIAVAATLVNFIARLIINMITFPFDLVNFGLPSMWAVILGSIYALLNITALAQLITGRST
jgi:hypothetical protein